MSPYTKFLAPRTSLSGRIQIGHKSGFYFFFMSSVNIKPTRHRFSFSLAWDWQQEDLQQDDVQQDDQQADDWFTHNKIYFTE
jgi:hypothetical protein